MVTAIGKAILTSLLLLCIATTSAQEVYQKPSPQILEVLSAPLTPVAFVSPQGDDLLLAEPTSYPPIADLAQPMLRLAGLRVNPKNNALHQASYFVASPY